MKKYLLFCIFLLIGFSAFTDTVAGTIEDGENVVYCTMVGDSTPFVLLDGGRNGKTKEFFVFYGQEKMGPYADVDDLTFSSNKEKVAYVAKMDRKYYVFLGMEKFGPYEDVEELTFSSDGKKIVYTAKVNRNQYVFFGEERLGPYDDVEKLVVSPDGKRLAYVIKMNKKHYVVLGNKELGPYDDVDNLSFSPDGNAISYIAKIDKRKSSMVYSEGATYTGSIYKNRIIYMDGNNIMIK